MDSDRPLTTPTIEAALVKIEAQRARIQPKLEHAQRIYDKKLRDLGLDLTCLRKWDRKCRYYARQLALANAGIPTTKPKPKKKAGRAIDL